jgi:uncharacterized membrane protein required for colicin V production
VNMALIKNLLYTKKSDRMFAYFFVFLDRIWIGQFVNCASRYVMIFTILCILSYVLGKYNFRIGIYECNNRS